VVDSVLGVHGLAHDFVLLFLVNFGLFDRLVLLDYLVVVDFFLHFSVFFLEEHKLLQKQLSVIFLGFVLCFQLPILVHKVSILILDSLGDVGNEL